MLIPYFYLKLDKLEIFQPQNTEVNFSYQKEVDGRAIMIKSISQPEFQSRTLFVNGSDPWKNYNMLNVSEYGERYLKAIKKINEEY